MRIVEVGPRDGLQNEPAGVPVDVKARFVADLARAGLREVEAGAFVSPSRVPAMADSDAVFAALPPTPGLVRWALVPNRKGLERALAAGAEGVALFTAASPAFVQKNLGTDPEPLIAEFAALAQELRDRAPGVRLACYISTVVECPFAGPVSPGVVVRLANRLIEEVGVDEVSLGETLGVAVPTEVDRLVRAMAEDFAAPRESVRWHFHDTRGTALANVARVMEWGGFGGFDASAGGLGGCPFAPGAGGNLATEDLVYFLERSGMRTGVNPEALARASLPVLAALGKPPTARAQTATLAACRGAR